MAVDIDLTSDKFQKSWLHPEKKAVQRPAKLREADQALNYSPTQARDKDGQFADGNGGISGPAVMSEADAKAATANSAYKELLWHGTSAANAREIAKTGFDPAKSKRGLHGDGVYLTPTYYDARAYAFGNGTLNKDNPQQVIKSYIDVKKPFISDYRSKDGDIGALTNKALGKNGYELDDMGYPKNQKEADAWHAEFKRQANEILKTHDALIIPNSGDEGGQPIVIVRDPSVIKIFAVEHVNAESRR